MSEAGGETIAHPADRHESIRTLLRAGRNDEAIVRLCAIHITRPSDLVARELLFDAYFQKRDWLGSVHPCRRPGTEATRRRAAGEGGDRLSHAQAELVQQWIDSGKPFHVIRDHVLHNELMIGCIWAGRIDCGIDIVEMMRRYFSRTSGPTARYGHDQYMLGSQLWPIIRDKCLVHDRFYRLPGINTVPLPNPGHCGAGRQDINAVLAKVDRLGIPRLS
jgi:hypothetical protein